MSNDSVVIVDGARTPMGGLQGSLSAVPATDLAATAIAATTCAYQPHTTVATSCCSAT